MKISGFDSLLWGAREVILLGGLPVFCSSSAQNICLKMFRFEFQGQAHMQCGKQLMKHLPKLLHRHNLQNKSDRIRLYIRMHARFTDLRAPCMGLIPLVIFCPLALFSQVKQLDSLMFAMRFHQASAGLDMDIDFAELEAAF